MLVNEARLDMNEGHAETEWRVQFTEVPSPVFFFVAGIPGVWKPWDWAAGVLIAREAGAIVSSGEGEDFRLMGRTVVAAATPALSYSLLNVLQ